MTKDDMDIDQSGWSGDGSFTPVLLDALAQVDAIAAIRLEDAPASRTDAGYAFIANELFVTFRTEPHQERTRRFGFLPRTRTVEVPAMSLEGLASVLESVTDVGAPDYADDGMLQYLRTERLVAPYQTKGVKVVEMVRIYEAGRVPLR